MNNRLKEIRLDNKMSQEEFGKRIGIESRGHISGLEKGTKNITDRIVNDVCREFRVNEEWLRTGNGDMYKLVEDEVSAAASDITDSNDDFIQDLIVVYRSLSQPSKNALSELATGMYARMKSREEKEREQD